MTEPRIIRIEVLDACFEGVVICREANGVLTRRRLAVPGDPSWTHSQAVRALKRQVHAT